MTKMINTAMFTTDKCIGHFWYCVRGGAGGGLLLHAPYVALSGNATTTYTGAGACGGVVGWGTVLQTGRSQIRFLMVSLEFFTDIILLAALWPWGKGGRCLGLTTLPPSCAYCLENLEHQTPGTLRACNGIALPLYTLGHTFQFSQDNTVFQFLYKIPVSRTLYLWYPENC
jgi:hypothetical protein